MSELLKNMFRRIAVQYGYGRSRSPNRMRQRGPGDPSVLDLSHRGHRQLFRRSTPFAESPASAAEEAPPQKSPELILPPPPERNGRAYGGRTDPYEALEHLRTPDNSFDFCVKRKDGRWVKDSDLRMLCVIMFCLFCTSVFVGIMMGYVALSGQRENSRWESLPDRSADFQKQEGFEEGMPNDHVEMELFKHSHQMAVSRVEREPEIEFDFSLASLGAKILTTRDTQAVAHYDASLLGYSIWSGLTSDMQPDAPLQPLLIPGRCWRFFSFPGTLVIQLAERITVTSFTLAHVLGSTVPKSRLKSAPFEFQVWGLQEVHDKEAHLFGNYTYSLSGSSSQEFPVLLPSINIFPIVELKVLSNYGSEDYTCVYRFKVFGSAHDDIPFEDLP